MVLVKAAVVAAARGAIHLLKGGSKAAAKTSTQTFKSLGAAGRSWKNVKMINSNVLQKQGIDAHALKREFLGRNAKIVSHPPNYWTFLPNHFRRFCLLFACTKVANTSLLSRA